VLVVDFRKKAVLISCVPAYIGGVLCVVCQLAASPELLMIGRFVTGINCGAYKDIARLILSIHLQSKDQGPRHVAD